MQADATCYTTSEVDDDASDRFSLVRILLDHVHDAVLGVAERVACVNGRLHLSSAAIRVTHAPLYLYVLGDDVTDWQRAFSPEHGQVPLRGTSDHDRRRTCLGLCST